MAMEAQQQTMQRVVIKQFGDKVENLSQVIELDKQATIPKPAAQQVLIQVHAAALNPVDYKMALGYLSLVSLPPPYCPGFDFAGVVTQVGSSCARIKVGEKVYGMAYFKQVGSLAEFMAIDEQYVARMPENMSFKEAASIPLAGLTSLQSLRSIQSSQNQRVLVLGGSGGTGLLGVQIAKALGAKEVIATASAVDLVKSVGADQVINYREQDWTQILKNANLDIVYDTVGGIESWEGAQSVIRKGGKYVTIAGDRQGQLNVGRLLVTGAKIVNRKFWGLFGYPSYDFLTTSTNYQDMDILTDMIQKNQLRALIDSEFTLAQASDAFARMASSRAKGKIVINIKD